MSYGTYRSQPTLLDRTVRSEGNVRGSFQITVRLRHAEGALYRTVHSPQRSAGHFARYRAPACPGMLAVTSRFADLVKESVAEVNPALSNTTSMSFNPRTGQGPPHDNEARRDVRR
jgi:hypothetical protein